MVWMVLWQEYLLQLLKKENSLLALTAGVSKASDTSSEAVKTNASANIKISSNAQVKDYPANLTPGEHAVNIKGSFK